MQNEVSFRLDEQSFDRALRDLSDRDARTAITWALNDTAQEVLEFVQGRMELAFDQPTRFTKNAFMVWQARGGTLSASVLERPSVGRRHYLKMQETGGRRGQTGLEKLLDSRLAFAGDIQAVTPAGGARLNAYGNWSTGERNRALSAVQAQRDATANTTEVSRKRNRKRAGYFVPRDGSRLSPGIWRRDAKGRLKKVMHFTTSMPTYQPRLGFLDGAEGVAADRLPDHLRRTIEKVVARAAARASGAG